MNPVSVCIDRGEVIIWLAYNFAFRESHRPIALDRYEEGIAQATNALCERNVVLSDLPSRIFPERTVAFSLIL